MLFDKVALKPQRERTVVEINGVKLPRPMTIHEAMMYARPSR